MVGRTGHLPATVEQVALRLAQVAPQARECPPGYLSHAGRGNGWLRDGLPATSCRWLPVPWAAGGCSSLTLLSSGPLNARPAQEFPYKSGALMVPRRVKWSHGEQSGHTESKVGDRDARQREPACGAVARRATVAVVIDNACGVIVTSEVSGIALQ